jgi:flagella basal body P-ring formation protein FlgA
MIALLLLSTQGPALAQDFEVRAELAAAVARVAGVPEADVEVHELGVDLSGCQGVRRVEVQLPAQQTLRSRVQAELFVEDGHGICIDASVMASVDIFEWVPVADEESPAGSLVPLRLGRVPRAELRGEPVPLEAAVVARQDLPAGEPATWTTVRPAPDVRKGQQLQVELVRDGLVISMPAVALASGQIGDTVRVRNLVSNWAVEVVLVAPDRAVPVRQ